MNRRRFFRALLGTGLAACGGMLVLPRSPGVSTVDAMGDVILKGAQKAAEPPRLREVIFADTQPYIIERTPEVMKWYGRGTRIKYPRSDWNA